MYHDCGAETEFGDLWCQAAQTVHSQCDSRKASNSKLYALRAYGGGKLLKVSGTTFERVHLLCFQVEDTGAHMPR